MNVDFTDDELKILDTFIFVFLGPKDWAREYLIYDGYIDCTATARSFEDLLVQLRNSLLDIEAQCDYYQALLEMEESQLEELYGDIEPDISHMTNPDKFAGPLKPSFMIRRF
jgi:hypothetical protein